MERVETEAQHVGTGGEHFGSSAHTEFHERRGGPAPGPQTRAGTLVRGARAQRLRGTPPSAREAQS